MSLINEALKKAQGQQQAQNPNVPPAPPSGKTPGEPPHSHSAPRKKHRSFIWGFLLSVLVVSIFSVLLTTYFVKQILGEDEKAPTKETAAVENTSVEKSEAPATDPGPEPGEPELDTRVPGTIPEDAAAETEDAPDEGTPEETALASTETESASQTQPGPPPPPQPPNPAVISRLMELEIRGVLGGSKVLILDQASGKTRAYRVGDTLEGSMGLMVEDISSSSIKLKDYAGFIHTKSF